MLTIHTTGDWPRGAVRVTTVPSTRRIVAEVEAAIDRAWAEGQQRLGSRLFDGPMCRMESWHASADALHLNLSLTSYRVFFGTNLSNPNLIDRFGRDIAANPVGISSAPHTRDGWLL